jgi:hypothetical protein
MDQNFQNLYHPRPKPAYPWLTTGHVTNKYHVSSTMVAEPTLFLSEDCMLQVRAHTTRSGVAVYCVRDFIRVIVNKPELKPSDAMVYWLSAACSKELSTEHAIMDQYPIRFLGPYEPKNICLNASGLLLLFDYLDRRFGFIWPQYKEEIRRRLLLLVEGKGSEYVWDHDDGEVDEMVAARDEAIARGEGLDGPPKDWKFNFDDKPPDPETVAQLQECVEAVEAMVEEKFCVEPEAVKPTRDKKASFTLKSLMDDLKVKVDQAFMPAFGKAVSTRFKAMCPGSETFTRKKVVYFYETDRECLEDIVQEEFIRHTSRRAGEEFENEGV